jgi:uncharacterized protein YbaP (TraB family)
MKKITLLLTLLISFFINSQEQNSLLWQISGNGLQKDSYLYGTMHVSAKVAFHLDDVFFESLLKADYVALETDPTFWLENIFNSPEEMKMFNGINSFNSNDFYNTPFKLTEPKQEQIMFFLSREDMLLNGVMYRTTEMKQNFEEDTFLDMFIYQSGKKNGKKIFSLEGFKESSSLVKKAVSSGKMKKNKPEMWLQKRLKDENYFTLMNNAYRDRNIQFLDSLNTSMYTENYMENMLYIRNRNMTEKIDSIAKTGSLFSAIGAAHLGGEKGVIEMLREKGYTVTALTSEITSKATVLKKAIEDKVIKVPFTEQTSEDEFFSVKVPTKLYELSILNNTVYLCPDLTNGGYAIITRISTFSKIHNKRIKNKDFDKFLFESIPGEIITQQEITKQGVKGVDIVNVTKTGDYQRYQIFFTPLEILIFKMDGHKTYVKDFGNQFFNSITFNNLSDEMVTVSPTSKGFEVDVPKYHSFANKTNSGNRLLQAVDKNGSYYFVKEVTLNDIKYIEEDAFELERIQERFYKNLDLEYKSGEFTNASKESFESNSKLKNGDIIYLKTVTNAGHYYLLGYISKNDENKNTFFNSFKITDFLYAKEKFTVQKDTTLHFSVKTNIEPPSPSFFPNYKRKKNKKYKGYTRNAEYSNNANEEIFVTLNKLNDLISFENVDSLWKKNKPAIDYNRISRIMTSGKGSMNFTDFLSKYRLKRKNIEKGVDDNGYNFYSYYVKDSLSSKAIKVKRVLSHGTIYDIKTLVDTLYTESKFVTTFYNSFKPKDTLIGVSLFTDKTAMFFDALKSKDSLSLDSYDVVKFKKKDINSLIEILKTYQFEENQLPIKKHLIEELGQFKTKKVERFLEDLYSKSFQNPENQITIINTVSKDETKESYKKLLKLLEADIPLTSNKYKLNSMIERMEDSLGFAKNLFPELLNYTTISEYKKPIYNLLSKLVDKKIVETSNYEIFKIQILNEAKIELKRQLGTKNNRNNYSSYSYPNKEDLLSIYVKLLFPFRKDKKVKSFYENLNFVDDATVKTTLIILQLENAENYNKETFKKLVSEIDSRGVLYKKLHKIDKTNLFPKEYSSKKEVYKSLLFSKKQEKDLNDSIVFISKRKFIIKDDTFEGYFFKSKPHANNTKEYNKDWKMNYIIVKNSDKKINIDFITSKKKQGYETTKSIEEVIDLLIEKERLKDRKRVNIKTNSYNNYNNY